MEIKPDWFNNTIFEELETINIISGLLSYHHICENEVSWPWLNF